MMANRILIQPIDNIYIQRIVARSILNLGVSVMNRMLLSLVISYLLISGYFLSNWLRFSLRHPTSAPEDKFLSFLMSLMTTIFWPLVIPIFCLDIIKKRNMELNTVIPILLGIFGFGVSYYLSYLH